MELLERLKNNKQELLASAIYVVPTESGKDFKFLIKSYDNFFEPHTFKPVSVANLNPTPANISTFINPSVDSCSYCTNLEVNGTLVNLKDENLFSRFYKIQDKLHTDKVLNSYDLDVLHDMALKQLKVMQKCSAKREERKTTIIAARAFTNRLGGGKQ